MKRVSVMVLAVVCFILAFLLVLFLIRVVSEKYLDDVTPGIPCEQGLLEKADVFYVIPKFENISIAENKAWCEQILNTRKRLAMHGIYHTYNEFLADRNLDYVLAGERIFDECFGFKPDEFKPPQLAISKNNIKMIKQMYKLRGKLDSLLHKAYHCNDTGLVKNWVVDLI